MPTDRVMLLIDADNVSIDIMEQAVQLLHKQHGALHVRRAYCTAESALKHQAVFKRLNIKPMVNLAAGKNSTDIALAVDAIDLVLAERPDVVVIASSDSDFAPLVQRLREKGCEVRGIGQLGKTGDETQQAYDDYTVLEHRKTAASDMPAPARKTPARKTAAVKKVASKKAPAARKTAARKAAQPPAAASADGVAAPAAKAPRKRVGRKPVMVEPDGPATVELPAVEAMPAAVSAATAERGRNQGQGQSRASFDAVLDCLSELRAGQNMALNTAARRLRDAQLLGQNSSSLKLFAAFPDRFELLPPGRPSLVRLRAG